jgi:hypothetical protein
MAGIEALCVRNSPHSCLPGGKAGVASPEKRWMSFGYDQQVSIQSAARTERRLPVAETRGVTVQRFTRFAGH